MVKARKKIGPINPGQLTPFKTYAHSLTNQWIVVSWWCGILAEPDLIMQERTQFDEMLSRDVAELESTLHKRLATVKPFMKLDEDLVSQMNFWLTQLQAPLSVKVRSNTVNQLRPLLHQLLDLVSHRLRSE